MFTFCSRKHSVMFGSVQSGWLMKREALLLSRNCP
jgi:hypothetical protein